MPREYSFDQLYGPAAGPVIDGQPAEVPAGFRVPETMEQRVQRLVRGALSRRAEEVGFESFEEANDFDIPDDPVDPSTPFEEFFDPTLGRSITPDEFRRFESEFRKEYLKVQANKIAAEDRQAAFEDAVKAAKSAKKGQKPEAGGGSPSDPPQPPVNAPKGP